MSKMKKIENGDTKTDGGDVWPSHERILDFITVVAGSYLCYEKASQSHFETQVGT